MTKILAGITLFVVFLCFPRSIFGQATQLDDSFCRKDPLPEIRAYCRDLAALQTAVNIAKASKTATTASNPNLSDALEKLDLTTRKAVPNFIAATAGAFATTALTSDALRAAGQARPDQQADAGTNASGTTSLVSKPGSAELLSLALDTGALTQSNNSTTTTLSSNFDEIFRLITGNNPDCTVNCNSLGWFENEVLNRTNISATFDLGQQSSKTTPTSGQASGTTHIPVSSAAIPTGVTRLNAITAQYQLMNKFDPRSDKFKTAWKAQVASLRANVTTIGTDTDAVFAVLSTHKPFSSTDKDALAESQKEKLVLAAVVDPSGKQLTDAFEAFWKDVTSEAIQDPNLASAVAKAMQDRTTYRTAWYNAIDQAVGNLLTFNYSYNRPISQPETHNLKLIYAYNFQSMGMLTFNGAVSIYGSTIPAGAQYGRIHDGQISGEYDRTLSGKNSSIQTQLSLAGYWQYQPNPSVLNIPAGTVAPGTTIPLPNGTQEFVGTAGSLWVTQAKITIKGSGGINIPIAVSWSNKTDLLQGNKWGAQVGISYNFSSFAGLFSGGNQ